MAGDYPFNVYNNMIVNNISTHEGGGVSLNDAPDVRFYNNTVMNNKTTATAITVQKVSPPMSPGRARRQPRRGGEREGGGPGSAAAGGGYYYYNNVYLAAQQPDEPTIKTAKVRKGDLQDRLSGFWSCPASVSGPGTGLADT